MTKAATTHTRPRSLKAYLAGPPEVSQRALADAVGCNQSMISMLAKGKRAPSARLAVQLHAVTGVPLKMLLAPRLAAAQKPKSKKRGPPGWAQPAGPR